MRHESRGKSGGCRFVSADWRVILPGMYTSRSQSAGYFLIFCLFPNIACSSDEPPSNANASEPAKAAHSGGTDTKHAAQPDAAESQIDLTTPPSGTKVAANAEAVRAMLRERFGRLARAVRVRVAGEAGDVQVQLRGEVPSEQARDAITREVSARVEGVRVHDFDLTISGPAPLIGIVETPMDDTGGACFTNDLRIAAIFRPSDSRGAPELWDLWTGRRINKPSLEGFGHGSAVALAEDGTLMATGHAFGEVVSWRLPMGEKPEVIEKKHDMSSWGNAKALAISPDCKSLAYVLSKDGGVWLRSLEASRENRLLGRHDPNMEYILRFSPDGNRLASADTRAAQIRLWDVKARALKRELPLKGMFVEALAWSPDSKTLAIARTTGQIGILLADVEGDKKRTLGPIEASRVRDLAFSPDGRTLAVRCEWIGVVLWDLATDKEWLRLDHRKIGSGGGLAFWPDGSVLAVACSGMNPQTLGPPGFQFWDVSKRPGASGGSGDFPPAGATPIATRDDELLFRMLQRAQRAPGMRKKDEVQVEILPDGSVLLTGKVSTHHVSANIVRDIEIQFPIEDPKTGAQQKRKVINEMKEVGY